MFRRPHEWLKIEHVTQVVMESTGPYWVPVFNILEQDVKVVLANPVEVKNRKGETPLKVSSTPEVKALLHAFGARE